MIQEHFTFKSIERLKSRKLIGQIFKEGISFSHFPFRVIYVFPEKNSAPLQSAFSVSSKIFKKTVDRNRIKRLMKETYRLQKKSLLNNLEEKQIFLAIFIIYIGKELPEYKILYDKMQSLFIRFEKIILKRDE